MDLAISSWSLHSLFLNRVLTPPAFIKIVRTYFGLRAVEFFEGDLCDCVLSIEPSLIDELQRVRDDEGMSVYAISAKNDLMTEDENAAGQDVESLFGWLEIAPRIGCKILRINTGLRIPTPASFGRAKERLRPLLEAAADKGVTLAVENHPHPIRTNADLINLLEFVGSLSNEGLRTCPDMGSFSDQFAGARSIEAFGQLANDAAHVHLKAPPDPASGLDPIEYYRPFIQVLQQLNYAGNLSLEFVEIASRESDPLTETWKASETIRQLIGVTGAARQPDLSIIEALAPRAKAQHTGSTRVIPDQPVKLAENILSLVVEGCRQKVGACTKLRTFVEPNDYPSHDWGHKCVSDDKTGRIIDTGDNAPFCAVVQTDPSAAATCKQFADKQFNRIKDEGDLDRRICHCPFGLTLMFQPVSTEEHLYGALSCGAWREAGTEGQIIYGIDHGIESDAIRQRALDSILRVPEQTASGLQAVQDTFQKVVNDLNIYFDLTYQEQKTRQQELLFEHISNQLRSDGFTSLDSAPSELAPILQFLTDTIAARYVAIYLGEVLPGANEVYFERASSHVKSSDIALPDAVSIPFDSVSNVQTLFSEQEQRETLRRFTLTPDFHEFSRLTEKKLAFFVLARSTDATPEDDRFIRRLWTEISHALLNAARLDEAQDQTDRLQLFADTARHSLNAPLQGLSSTLGRLRSQVQRDAPQHKIDSLAKNSLAFLDEASAAVDRLSGAGLRQRVALRERRVFRYNRLGGIIKRASAPFKLSGEDRGIKIDINERVFNLPKVECDREQIRILFSNLVENAVKYSHRGRTVEVSGQHLADDPETGRESVQITVRDFGLGIPSEYYEKVFEPYEQVPIGDVVRSIPGTGLGLFICRQVIEGHQGRLSVSCTIPAHKRNFPEVDRLQGCWVVFTVVLPVRQPREES